jgi:hypothetical protein
MGVLLKVCSGRFVLARMFRLWRVIAATEAKPQSRHADAWTVSLPRRFLSRNDGLALPSMVYFRPSGLTG